MMNYPGQRSRCVVCNKEINPQECGRTTIMHRKKKATKQDIVGHYHPNCFVWYVEKRKR